MTRLTKIQAKIALSFCTLFCLWPYFAFSQQVSTAWVARYDGPANGEDYGVSIAVDDSGNVYVIGTSDGDASHYDLTTIKYLPKGDTAWVRRYNGLANSSDYATAISVDDSGHIYVTGTIWETGGMISGPFDYVTIKYAPNGDTLWVRRFNTNPGPLTDEDCLFTAGLGLDSAGNVYVGGSFERCNWEVPYGGFETIKYNPNGDILWRQSFPTSFMAFKYAFANAMVVGKNGDVAVTGQSNLGSTGWDFATVKYDADGYVLWQQTYTGPGNTNDIPHAVASDKDGNVFVTGVSDSDFTTIKYDVAGNQQWARRFQTATIKSDRNGGYALVTDIDGNVIVTGQTLLSGVMTWVTIKYDSTGNQAWVNQAGADSTRVYSIAADSGGNIYVTSGEGFYRTIKYGPRGDLMWSKESSSLGPCCTVPTALTLDSSENVCVTGTANYDFFTVKYSQSPILKGDLNLDGTLSAADVVLSLNCIFLSEAPPAAQASCDLNCDGRLSAADVVILLRMVFASAPAPC